MSSCLNHTRPDDGLRCPLTRLKNVVFPAPLGPMIEKISPFCISKEISLRAFNPLKEIDRLFTLKNDISGKNPGPEGPALITPVRGTIVNAIRCELRVTGCGSKKIEERITKDETNSSTCMNKINKKYYHFYY